MPASSFPVGLLRSFDDNEFVKRTLDMINAMRADGVISHYAIGGAVGATFYLEPAATVDLDIFVILPSARGLLTLAPLYTYLKAHGGIERDEYIILDDWPVQFLPPSDDLELEAIETSVAAVVEGVNTWIMSAECLAAIALRTGRAKDHNRVLQFMEQDAVDRKKLQSILERHGLNSKWKQFEHNYLAGDL